jgi:carbamoyltransferase
MSVILGINAFHAGASASIIVDGVPLIAISEERLNRVKNYAGFPTKSIERCLSETGIKYEEIEHVAIGRDKSANQIEKLKYVARHPTKLLNLAKIKNSRNAIDDMKQLIATHCHVDIGKLKFQQHNIEHHIAHIASSFFSSGWEDAAGITIDGSGDFVSCTMSECVGNSIKIKKRIYIPHSLGSLYTMVCEFIGYNKYGDEGKVMGLAPLGENTYEDELADMIKLTDDGFDLNARYFLPFGSNQGVSITDEGEMIIHRHYSDLIIEKFGNPTERHAEITKRDMDLAYSLQKKFEDVYIHLINILSKIVPNKKLVIAGGCALNSVANGKIFNKTPYKETFIHPAPGDDGLAVGAALYVSNSVLKEGVSWKMKDAYLGTEYTDIEIQDALDRHQVKYTKLSREEILDKTTDEVIKGNVIGWFQGKMEWGPRALGNRSIIAHPGLPDMKDILNSRIKHRENFRPFAPSVLQEYQDEIFEHDHPSPFMLHVYKIKDEWRKKLCAVNHVDNTGRLQTVTREENSLYYDLIKKFYEKSGTPILLNTSFNENEPVVESPDSAIECYLRTKMDTLVIGSYFCTKHD